MAFFRVILFLLFVQQAYSQPYIQSNNYYGTKWNRGQFNTSLHIPYGDTVLNTTLLVPGAIKFRNTGGDTTLYIWDGTYWRRSGGGGGTVDTTVISTRAWRDKLADSLGAIKLGTALTSAHIWVGAQFRK